MQECVVCGGWPVMADVSDMHVRWRLVDGLRVGEYALSALYPYWLPFCTLVRADKQWWPLLMCPHEGEPGFRLVGDAKRWSVARLEEVIGYDRVKRHLVVV